MLETQAQRALQSKIAGRQEISVPLNSLVLFAKPAAMDWLGPDYDAIPQGTFIGLENIYLRWIRPDWFEYIPSKSTPFSFKRSNGDNIIPRRMFTDGGSIPRTLWPASGLSPWGYAPAFLVHDWLFDLHHCKRGTLSFEAARDCMMEGVKTLMELGGYGDRSTLIFKALFVGIDSQIARSLWDKPHSECPLPPELAIDQ